MNTDFKLDQPDKEGSSQTHGIVCPGGFLMNLAEKITSLRKQHNWSQKELAEKLGVHKNHVNRYEKGGSSPSIDALKRMAMIFGVSTDYFLFDKGDSVAGAKLKNQALLNRFEKVEEMELQDKEAIMTILDGMIIKNQVKQAVEPELQDSWKAEIRETLSEIRKRSKKYTEKDILNIVNSAVAEARSSKPAFSHAKKAAGGARY